MLSFILLQEKYLFLQKNVLIMGLYGDMANCWLLSTQFTLFPYNNLQNI